MREKVILQDFTVLLVCPSQKWSTIERRVLFDSTLLRNMGCNPVILCYKNSQIDIEADIEDIPRVYISSKLSFYKGTQFLAELRRLVMEKRFDIIHCYSLFPLWFSAFILGSHQHIPLFLTYNENIQVKPFSVVSKWLLRRVDFIFTLSKGVEDFLKDVFPVPPKKLRTLGTAIELGAKKPSEENESPKQIGCVINNLTELQKLHFPIKTFRLLKNEYSSEWEHLELFIFLGPRVYQQDRAKDVLTELDYEFYKGDIHLISLKGKESRLKEVDIFFGTAFDEPINDYEIAALISGIPVLFPRTGMRQSLVHAMGFQAESYFESDLREAKAKLLILLKNNQVYCKSLENRKQEIVNFHGLESYVSKFQKFYEMAYSKRLRLKQKKGAKS